MAATGLLPPAALSMTLTADNVGVEKQSRGGGVVILLRWGFYLFCLS
jgi:hypothetical protein